MPDTNPLTLTTNPRLSLALHGDGAGFEHAVVDAGQEKTTAWLRNRIGDEIDPEILSDALAAWFGSESPDDLVMARVDLAELLTDVDDPVAELLWDASRRDGFERNDGDQAFDAAVHLSRMAEAGDDPLTAAEFYIEFLNWRRTDQHVSDPESVHQALEEIVRLAQLDGAAASGARFAHAHSVFTRLVDDDAAAAVEGDWIPADPPFSGWE